MRSLSAGRWKERISKGQWFDKIENEGWKAVLI